MHCTFSWEYTEHYELPTISRDELSEKDAQAVRRREARQALVDREVAKQAAVDAARKVWWQEQADLLLARIGRCERNN